MDNEVITNYVELDNCELFTNWNAKKCVENDVGILFMDSLDDDRYDRMITPITITKSMWSTDADGLPIKVDDPEWHNVINTQMDHVWDGFYSGQLRQSRWPTMI